MDDRARRRVVGLTGPGPQRLEPGKEQRSRLRRLIGLSEPARTPATPNGIWASFGRSWTAAAVVLVCVVVAVTACDHTVIEGRAASMLYDPDRVGGLPAAGGLTGVRPYAPAPTGVVKHTDGGADDRLALLAVNDVQDFWAAAFPEFFSGQYVPVSALISYDSTNPLSHRGCVGSPTYRVVNASYCVFNDSVYWDRASLIPTVRTYFGDVSVAGLLGHELGHAVQNKAHLVTLRTLSIIKEQQADCFAGVYLRWIAEGHSRRFAMNTTDGLDHVLAGGITLRDPIDL